MNNPTLPESERQAARDEISELLKADAKGGKVIGQAGRSADRVRKAVRRFIDDLNAAEIRRGEPNKVLREFGKHLEQHLWLPSMGGAGRRGAAGKPGCFTYTRPVCVTWKD